jgi:hypothetical protein
MEPPELFQPMQREDLLRCVDQCYSESNDFLQVVLVDGESLTGRLPGKRALISDFGDCPDSEAKGMRLTPSSEVCFSAAGDLILRHDQPPDDVFSVMIPVSQIAGVGRIEFRQEQAVGTDALAPEAYCEFGKILKRRATMRGFSWFPEVRMYSPFGGHFRTGKWGKVHFKAPTALYCDWEYLQNRSGGINNVGLGVPIVSISFGWENSLWAKLFKHLKSRKVELSGVEDQPECTVSGFVSFINHAVAKPKNQDELTGLEMEGAEWVPAVMSEKRAQTYEDLKTMDWCFVYFRNDALMFPKRLWDHLSDAVTVFGEVFPAEIETENEKKNCFLKARAAAYIP